MSHIDMSCLSDRQHSAKRRKLSATTCLSRNSIPTYHDQAHHQHNDYEMRNANDTGQPTTESSDSGTTDGLGSTSCPSTAPSLSEPSESFCEENVSCREVCFGMITDCNLAPLGRSTLKKAFDPSTVLQPRIRADAITLLSPTSEEIGVLDVKTTRVITALIKDNPQLALEAYADQDRVQQRRLEEKCNKVFPLCINIYGPSEYSDRVALILSEARVFLQEPTCIDPASTYHNPHFLHFDDSVTPRFLGLSTCPPRDFAAEVDAILEHSDVSSLPTEVEQDQRIQTKLQYPQLAALQFMVARENEHGPGQKFSLWRPSCRFGKDVFVHTVTQEERVERPCEARGGLLADTMGAGKSLTLLAVILHTLDETRIRSRQEIDPHQRKSSGATLIIAPKSTLYNWRMEIKKHIYPDTLNVHVYHGTGTAIDQGALKDKDVVLTTYETASFDHFKSGTLGEVSWFRVVLDEAHQIRNRSTKTFKAIMGLHAQRRWCLTGTPVHNKLADLFSLTTFLRFYPVDNDSNARRYILEPLGRKDPQVLADLRSIMTTVALRRPQVADTSRNRSERVEAVALSPAERGKYNEILSHAQKMLAASTRSTSSSILLGSILKLRQICSHGISDLVSSITKRKWVCIQCGDLLASTPTSTETRILQQAELCYDCELASSESTAIPTSGQSKLTHSLVETDRLTTELNLGKDSLSPDIAMSDFYAGQEDSFSSLTEKSSKLEKVITNLRALQQMSEGNQNPIKSLVFSCWTTTLDALELTLTDQNMQFVRIDGSQSLDERAMKMDRFQSDPILRIMLLSTGCGSTGLNLTAASYVHLVEPQWNPMVEAQAAARIDRLDQTKDIAIIRYVVEGSIEERIQARQQRKILLAEFSVSRMSTDPVVEDILGEIKVGTSVIGRIGRIAE